MKSGLINKKLEKMHLFILINLTLNLFEKLLCMNDLVLRW